jgi:hypothetical protein
MATQRKQYDMKSPETRALRDEIVHGTFVKEGTLLAFPTCFPGASVPIRADESRITALDATPDGAVYGGTSGRATHLFVGMFHGVTGAVLDMGEVEGADQCAAVCCGKEYFAAGVNGKDGGRLVGRRLQPLPFDLIQEWGFRRQPIEELGEVGDGERIVHLAACLDRGSALGTSEGHLFAVDLAGKTVEVLGEVAGRGQVGVDADGRFLGLDGEDGLWRYDRATGELEREAVPLPPDGRWEEVELRWARDPGDGTLYATDGEGRLFAYRPADGWSRCLGQAPLAPVGPMAVTFDGRLFGFCGEGIARLFVLEKDAVRDLGVAASVFERRRYGYAFGAAAVGRDGELVFGEDDDLGHLWLYFPRIPPR